MRTSLSFGKRLYDWWGRHPLAYKFGSFLVFLGRERALREKAVDLIRLEPGHTVLDLACGNGINFQLLEERIGERGKILGFDYSEGMLQAAEEQIQRRGWRNIHLVQGDAARMSIHENSLDGAFCSLGLSAIPDHVAAIQNVFLALKPGKHFVVLDAKLFDGWAKIFNFFIRPIFQYSTNWDYEKEIITDLKHLFSVEIHLYNAGSLFIANCTKTE